MSQREQSRLPWRIGLIPLATLALSLPAGAVTRYWDGGGSGTKWSSGGNWRQLGVNDDVVPGTGDTVILDHTYVAGAYTVQNDVGGGTASLAGLTIDPAGGAAITLDLNGKTLNVDNGTANLTVQAGGAFGSMNSNYTIVVSGNWTNNGTPLNSTTGGEVDMNGGIGVPAPTIGGTAFDVFYDLFTAVTGQTTSLGKNISVSHIMKIQGGTLNSNVLGSFRTVTLTRTADPLDTMLGLTVTDVKFVIDPAGAASYNLAKVNGALFDLEINDTVGNGGGAATITFFSNMTFKHDLRVVAGTLDSRNKTVTIEHDLIQDGGTLLLDPGTIVMNAAYADASRTPNNTGDLTGGAAGTTSFNKLTLGKGGQTRTVRLGRSISVNDIFDVGDVVVGGGGGTTTVKSTVDGTVRTVTLAKNSDALYVAANSTLSYVSLILAGTNNWTLNNVSTAGVTLFSVEVNSPGFTVTAGTSLGTSMTGDFTMTAGTFRAGSFTHKVGRDFVFNGGTFTPDTSTFDLNGSGQIRGSATGPLTFYNLNLAASGQTITLARGAAATSPPECAIVSNNLTLGPGTGKMPPIGSWSLQDEADSDGVVRMLTLTKNTGSPLVFTGASPTVSGDVRLKFKPSPTASYTISGPAPLSLGSVQIACGAASTITFGQALTLNGDLEFGEAGVTTGNLTMGAFSHTLARGFTWDLSTGTLNTTGTSLTFTGTGTIGGANTSVLTVDNFTVNGAATDTLTLGRSLTVNAGVLPPTCRILRGILTTSGLSGAITVNANSGVSVGDGAGSANEAELRLIGPVTLAIGSGQALTVNTSADAVKDGKLYANSDNNGTPTITRIGGAGSYAFTIYGGTTDVNALNVSYTNGNGMDVTIPTGASPNIVNLNGVAFSNSTTVSLKITLNAGVYGCDTSPFDFGGLVFNATGVTNVSFLPSGGCGVASNACPGSAVSGWIRMVGFGGPNAVDVATAEAGDADCANPADTGVTGTVIEWVPPKKWISNNGLVPCVGSSTDWFLACNWSPSGVPSSTDSVVIPTSTDTSRLSAAMPAITAAATANAQSITQLGDATLTLSAAGSLLKINGRWTSAVTEPLSPVPTAGSTIEFNGTSAQTTPNSNNYQKVTISNAAGVTLGNGQGTVTLNDSLTVTGKVDWGNGTVIVKKDVKFNGASGQTVSPAGSGTVRFDEATATADITTDRGAENALNTIEFPNLTINGTISCGDWIDVLVRRTFTINSGKTFALSATAGAAGTRALKLGGLNGVAATWNNLAGTAGFAEGSGTSGDRVEFVVPVSGPDVQGPNAAEDFYDLKVSASAASATKAHIRAGTTTVANTLTTATGGVFTIDPGATVVLSSATGVIHSIGAGTELRLESNASVAATLQIRGNDLHKVRVDGKLRTTWDETILPLPPRPAITRRAGDTGRFKFGVFGSISVDGLAFSYGGVTGADADFAVAPWNVDPYADSLVFAGTGSSNALRNADFSSPLSGNGIPSSNTARAGAHIAVRTNTASVSLGGCTFDSGSVVQVFAGTDLVTSAASNVVIANGGTDLRPIVRIGQILQIQSGSDIGGYMITNTNATAALGGINRLQIDTNLTTTASAPSTLTYRVIDCNIRAEDTNGGGDVRVLADASNGLQEEDRDFDDFKNGPTVGDPTATSMTAKNPVNATANSARVDWITRVTNIVPLDEAGSVAADSGVNDYRTGVQGTFSLTVNAAGTAYPNPVPGGTLGYIGPRGYYLGGRKVLATGVDAPDRLVCIELADDPTRGRVLATFEIAVSYGEVLGPPVALILGIAAADADAPDTAPSTLTSLPGASQQVEDIFFGTSGGYLFRVRHDFAGGEHALRLCGVARGAGSAFPIRPYVNGDANGSTCANPVSMCVEFTSPCSVDIFNPTQLFFGVRAVGANGCDNPVPPGPPVDDVYRIYGASMNTGKVMSATLATPAAGLGKPVRSNFALLTGGAAGNGTVVYAGTDGAAGVPGALWTASTAMGFTVFNSFDAGNNEHFRSPVTVGIYADRVFAGNNNGKVYGREASVLGPITAGFPSAGYNSGSPVVGGVIMGWDSVGPTNQNIFFGNNAGNLYGLDGFTGALLAGYPVALASPRAAGPEIKSLPIEGPVSASDGNYFYVGDSDGILFYVSKSAPATKGVFYDFGSGKKLRDIATAFGKLYIPTASGDVFVVSPKP